jgi:hypothetical protein
LTPWSVTNNLNKSHWRELGEEVGRVEERGRGGIEEVESGREEGRREGENKNVTYNSTSQAP